MKMKFIRQSEATECGLAAICMVANHHGHRLDLAGLRQRFNVSLKGAGLRDIMAIADGLGLGSRALRCEPEHLGSIKLPAILHWNLNHFVVLTAAGTRKMTILDPAKGERVMSRDEVADHFTGVVLELTPTKDFEPVEDKRRTRLTDLWSNVTGLRRALFQVLIFSLALQILTLALPFYLQLTIDEAVLREDRSLLLVLAVGFGFLYVLQAGTEAFRSWVILILGQSVTFQMAGNVLRHLIRLPAVFFEKRHVGDIISRVGSVKPIQEALTQSLIAAILDGMMAITTGILIIVYSWQLALVVMVSVTIYTAASLLIFPFLRRREEDLLAAHAGENTYTIETIRASRAVKLFGREAEREAGWRNAYTSVINAGVKVGGWRIGMTTIDRLLFGLQLVLVVYLGARAIIAGDLTIGMLFAFLAYRQNFADRITGLVQKIISFRMLGLHLERLGDIIHERPEMIAPPSAMSRGVIRGGICVKNITYSYGSNEAPVLQDVSMDIAPGAFIAITGPAGGGQTTLLKLMLGLLAPERGEILIDGLPIAHHGLSSFRAETGVVMQDDALLSGTIADNIAFFDPELDMGRVQEAAMQAHIHDDIARMPMNYLSMIGDMGAALSGGQRQRLLIARALYRNPRILFMDEGTANLDEEAERCIADVLSAMPITRVVIAHRPELVRRAQAVYVVKDRTIGPVSRNLGLKNTERPVGQESL
jgi:ATP-binding cassette subfamily B protein RaxB